MRQKVSLGRIATIVLIVTLTLLSIRNYKQATQILKSASNLALTEEQNSNLQLSRRQVSPCLVDKLGQNGPFPYFWVEVKLQWFFDDYSFSRTNSNGTYRYEK